MELGIVLAIFFLGTAAGALLESTVRLAFRRKLEREFLSELNERLAADELRRSRAAYRH
jgi:hypothetical protein